MMSPDGPPLPPKFQTVTQPPGWTVVPREPTREMIEAGARCVVSHSWSSKGEHITDPEVIYEAMLAAAPDRRALTDAAMKENSYAR